MCTAPEAARASASWRGEGERGLSESGPKNAATAKSTEPWSVVVARLSPREESSREPSDPRSSSRLRPRDESPRSPSKPQSALELAQGPVLTTVTGTSAVSDVPFARTVIVASPRGCWVDNTPSTDTATVAGSLDE